VDVIEIDAASNRGIDAMRELRENVRYSPARDRYKVFIIDEAHQITPEGFNALLKTLEEPPPASLLILISAAPDDLLPTIRSRCQTVRFFPLGQPQLAQWLATERQWTAGDATLTSAIAGGCLGLALSTEPALLRDERDQIERWLAESCLNPADPARAADRLVEGAESAAQTPERFERTLLWLRLWLQDTVRAAAVPGGAAPVRFPSAHRAAELVPLSACSELAAQLHWTWRASFRNINRQLLLEHWLIALRDAVIDARRPRPTRERVAR
jgi:hypothetical protein